MEGTGELRQTFASAFKGRQSGHFEPNEYGSSFGGYSFAAAKDSADS